VEALFAGGDNGGHSNVVRVINQQDGKVRSEGRAQGNHIPGPNVQPVNQALAYGSCNGCQTYAIALQLDLVSNKAANVQPKNEALAVNYHCTGCTTIARALQYVIPEDDPDQLPDRAHQLLRRISTEVDAIQRTPGVTPDQAEARINAAIGQFQDLAQDLNDKRSVANEDTTPNATPVASETPSASSSPAASGSPSARATAAASPAQVASPAIAASPSGTTSVPSAAASVAATPSATVTPAANPASSG